MLLIGYGLILLVSYWKLESGYRIKVLNVLKIFYVFRKFKFLLI